MPTHKKSIWMKVSKDKYKLPEAIADTAPELSEIIGMNKHAIYKAAKIGKVIERIEVEDDDQD